LDIAHGTKRKMEAENSNKHRNGCIHATEIYIDRTGNQQKETRSTSLRVSHWYLPVGSKKDLTHRDHLMLIDAVAPNAGDITVSFADVVGGALGMRAAAAVVREASEHHERARAHDDDV